MAVAPAPPVQSVQRSSSPFAESGGGEITAQQGESLFNLARRANVPMRSLIDANRLQPPYTLQGGQVLTLPRVRTYRVQPGDTLSSLGRRFGLGTNELVRINTLPPPYAVQPGQVLTLPAHAVVPATMTASVPASQDAALPTLPGRATSQIETQPSGPIESSSLPPPPGSGGSTVAPQQQTTAAVAPPPAVATPPSAPAAPAPTPPSAAPATAVVPGLPAPRAQEQDPEPPATRSGRAFQWPLRGPVISDFGAKPGGLQNDGINISAPRGTPIRAADAGVVVYSGNELRGFGNLLLVRHRDGWVTAYAHAEELTVKRGDQVQRGQVIGRVGNSGGVAVPQLHFEVRRGSRPVNPRDFLGT